MQLHPLPPSIPSRRSRFLLRPGRTLSLVKLLTSVALSLSSLKAAVLMGDFALGGTQQTTTLWTNLSNTNPTMAPASGTGTLTVATPGYRAGSGLYSYTGNYSVTATQTASYDIQSVMFQLELAPNTALGWPFNGGPMLSVNGGAYILAPVNYFSGSSEPRYTFGDVPLNYTAYGWQWDLSSIPETVTSVSIYSPIGVHSSTTGVRLDVGDVFMGNLNVAPEPGRMMMLSLALTGLAMQRRRPGGTAMIALSA